MTRTGQVLVAEAPRLLHVAAAFLQEIPSELNTSAPLQGNYKFFANGREGPDISIPFHVPGKITLERGVFTCYVGQGSTNIIIKAAFIRALIECSESVRLHRETLMTKDIDDLRVEFVYGGQRCRIDYDSPVPILKFFLTKARASLNFGTASAWDEKYTLPEARWDYFKEYVRYSEVRRGKDG